MIKIVVVDREFCDRIVGVSQLRFCTSQTVTDLITDSAYSVSAGIAPKLSYVKRVNVGVIPCRYTSVTCPMTLPQMI